MPSMQAALSALDGWLLKTTLGGGAVLLVGALWMLLSRQPVKRQRIGELALLFALLVALPAALPGWWSLPGTIKSDFLAGQPTAGHDVVSSSQCRDDLHYKDEFESGEEFELYELLGFLD